MVTMPPIAKQENNTCSRPLDRQRLLSPFVYGAMAHSTTGTQTMQVLHIVTTSPNGAFNTATTMAMWHNISLAGSSMIRQTMVKISITN
jgi:hypothetical protein